VKFLEAIKQLLQSTQSTKDFLSGLSKIFSEQKEDTEVKAYLAELNKVTPESAKAFIDSEDGKKFLQPILDSYHTKGLETWKSKTLPKLLADEVEKEVQKRHPAETEAEKRLRKLEADLAEEKQGRLKETLKNKALSVMTAKGLPIDLVDHFVGSDEAGTLANLQTFENAFSSHVSKIVEARMANGGREPHSTSNDPKTRLQELEGKLAAGSNLRLEEKIAIKNEIASLQKST